MLSILRRTILALSVASVVASYLTAKGLEKSPTLQGGWRELTGPYYE